MFRDTYLENIELSILLFYMLVNSPYTCLRNDTIIERFDYQYSFWLKFIYSEMATLFCVIFPLILTTVDTVKNKGKIVWPFQNIWTLPLWVIKTNYRWSKHPITVSLLRQMYGLLNYSKSKNISSCSTPNPHLLGRYINPIR